MNKSLTILLVLMLNVGLLPDAHTQSKLALLLDSLIPQWMEEADVPGLSIAVLDEGKLSHVHSFGKRHINRDLLVNTATIFEAASLTKPVFTYAVMKLVDNGTLDLDRPLESYWPYLDIATEPLKDEITARTVLTHTTGYRNWRRPRGAEKIKINFRPGERFSYSGEGFVHLSKVVEHLTGMTLENWIHQTVFLPLDMKSSAMIWTSAMEENHALPHDREGAVKEKFKPNEANAAASLHTTATDYAKFLAVLLQGKGLSKESHRLMISTQQRVDPQCSQCSQPNSDPSFTAVSWGLGIGLESNKNGNYLWHWGDNGNFKAYFCVSLETGSGLVYFANSHGGLALRNNLVSTVLPGMHPAHEWVSYKQIGE